ncbi:MAG TPA: electron transport complex subunit RsxC [bacterium]|nr:electron transport complex subunit RsxC [bacterium]
MTAPKKSLFPGGIHPAEEKVTAGLPLVSVTAPKELVLPLNQHIGKPSKPVVKPGDMIYRGTLMAERDGFVSASLHSPVSGTVKSIEPRLTCDGKYSSCIVIENDGRNEERLLTPVPQPASLSGEKLLSRIAEAGIVGLGGACFPAHVKLQPPQSVHVLIINACECEPYLTADELLLLEKTSDLLLGIKIIRNILKPKKVHIGIEANKEKAADYLKKTLFDEKSDIELTVLPARYPQGGEKQLIQSLTGKTVPPEGLPFQAGCIVQNVQTVIAIKEAVVEGKPLMDRTLTLSGFARKPGHFSVPLGMLLSEFLKTQGEIPGLVRRAVIGGPMMGVSISSLDVPVTKSTSGVLLLEDLPLREQECIRCARCVDVCPVNLLPTEIYRAFKAERYDLLPALYPADCMECGCCAYSCPSQIPLVQYLKWAKKFKSS